MGVTGMAISGRREGQEAMLAHVVALCVQHEIEIRRHSRGGRACALDRWVAIRPVRSVVTYAVALHEIGHVIGRGRSKPRLEAEGNALPGTVNERCARVAQRSCMSYLRWAERTKDRQCAPKIPERSHIFWCLVAGWTRWHELHPTGCKCGANHTWRDQ